MSLSCREVGRCKLANSVLIECSGICYRRQARASCINYVVEDEARLGINIWLFGVFKRVIR